MATGTLYRATRNAHGDTVDDHGNTVRLGDAGTEIGTLRGLVIGGPPWSARSGARGDIVDTTGQVGVPVGQLQPQHGDLLVIGSICYAVKGPPQWASRGLVSTPPRYRWWTATATAN